MVKVFPFTVVGVIAPNVKDSAPSVLEADTPLAVVTRLTSVPVVAGSVCVPAAMAVGIKAVVPLVAPVKVTP